MNIPFKSWKMCIISLSPGSHLSIPLSLKYSILIHLRASKSIKSLQQKSVNKLRFMYLATQISAEFLLNWVKYSYYCKDKTDQEKYYKLLTVSNVLLVMCILMWMGLSPLGVHSLYKIITETRQDSTRNLLPCLVLINTKKMCR